MGGLLEKSSQGVGCLLECGVEGATLMDKLADAFLGSLADNPLVALVLLSVMANVVLGATIRRLFTLYVTVTEKRIEESDKARSAIADNSRMLERIADILKVSMK
jgi:hypothetical protein